MSSLQLRAASALVAVIGVALVTYYWRADGLVFLSSVCVLLVVREFARLVFTGALRFAFIASCAIIYAACVFSPNNALPIFAVLGLVLQSWVMGRSARGSAPRDVYIIQGFVALGLLYCAILPSFTVRLLFLDDGLVLFATFLLTTFAGDVAAYFTGLRFGRKKLLASVSPKKTVEGSIGGLLGSTLTAALCAHFFSLPLIVFIPLGVLTGALGQIGDLFESLVKRVADVKDSGSIMPGHGGMWDRLDGIYFSAPFFYFVVSQLQAFLDL